MNTHGLQFDARERQAFWSDAHPGYVVSGGIFAVPSSSLTIAATASVAYVEDSGELIYVNQSAAAITIADATPTWIAIHRDRTTAVSGWTRQSLTHYIFRQSASEPATPAGALILAEVTVAASVITVVRNFAYRSPLDAERKIHNIESWGADVATADNSVEIQNAFDTAGAIEIPAGSYAYATTLVLSNNTRLMGSGQNLSFLTYTGTADAVQINNPINSSTAAHISLEHFAISSNNGSPAALSACLADIGSTFLHLDHVRMLGNSYGLILDQTEVSTVSHCFFEGQITVGLWFVNGPEKNVGASPFFTNQISVKFCQFNRVALANTFAIINDGGADHEFQNCNINGWGTWARLAAMANTKFTNCEWEGAVDAIPIAFHPNSSVSGTAQAGGTVCTFDTNTFGNGATQKCIEVLAGNTQNTIILLGNAFGTSTLPHVTGGAILGNLVEIGNFPGTNGFYDAQPAKILDYEASTWTPTGNGVTLTVTSAFYTRIGRQVTVQFDVTWPTTADGGQARIEGLPFTPRTGWFSTQTAQIISTTVFQPFTGDTNTFIVLYDDGVGIKTNANLSTFRVAGSYTYFTS